MFHLFLTICLLTDPSRCKVEEVPFVEYTGANECMYQGQIKAAEYIKEHPDWKLVRYECGAPKT